jgi:type IV secretion system protein VirD4
MMERATPNPPLLIGRQANKKGGQRPENIELEKRAGDDVKSLGTGSEEIVGLSDGSHALTISADARERLRASIIPNLLTYPGSVVVIDLSGEAYAATVRARRDMGQTIVRLDPFRVVDTDTDALNPIDLLKVDESAFEATCQYIAALIPGFHAFADIWDGQAFGLLSGVIGYLAAVAEKNKFSEINDVFHNADVVYNLAVVLDTVGGKISKMSYSEIASFLEKTDAERSRILSAVTAKIKALNTEATRESFKGSTVTPAEIIEGKPVSVYLMMPPEMMPTHYSLLNIWIGTLLRCVRDRRFRAEIPMLFLLDETAKFSPFPQMQAAITSPAANKLRIWTFWQDVQQIRTFCPGSWIFENCGAVQAFGTKDFDASSELAATLGIEPKTIHSLTTYEQIVSTIGVPHRIKKFDYHADPLFKGLFD